MSYRIILAHEAPFRPYIFSVSATATLSVRRISEGCQRIVATVLTAKPSIYEEKPSVRDFEVAGSNRPPETTFLLIVKLVS